MGKYRDRTFTVGEVSRTPHSELRRLTLSGPRGAGSAGPERSRFSPSFAPLVFALTYLHQCDGTYPGCLACARLGVPCTGYGARYVWVENDGHVERSDGRRLLSCGA